MHLKLLMLNIIVTMIVIAKSSKNGTDKKGCGCNSDNKTYVSNQTGTLQKDSLGGDFYIYKRQAGSKNISSKVCNADEVKNISPGSNVTYKDIDWHCVITVHLTQNRYL
jgi:hypothetical protein